MQFSDVETKIFNFLIPTIELLGYELVLTKIVNEGGKTLRIVIDSKGENRIGIDDCQKVTRAIAPLLDVENLIADKYLLEVSSAGVERPLVRQQDYVRFIGRVVLIKLHYSIDNQKKYKGKLLDFHDNNIIIEVESADDPKVALIRTIPLEKVKAANLVMTDEMFKAILKG